MSDPILDQYQKLRWEALKERRDWIRWIVPLKRLFLAYPYRFIHETLLNIRHVHHY
jgi:hypothetical protein